MCVVRKINAHGFFSFFFFKSFHFIAGLLMCATVRFLFTLRSARTPRLGRDNARKSTCLGPNRFFVISISCHHTNTVDDATAHETHGHNKGANRRHLIGQSNDSDFA